MLPGKKKGSTFMKKSFRRTAVLLSAVVIFSITATACQSTRYPMDREEPLEYGKMGKAYFQDDKKLEYDSVQLELLRNHRSRSMQVAVNKWENRVLLQVASVTLIPIPFYIYHDAALRRESVEAYNESLEREEILVDVENWKSAGFISTPQGEVE